MPSRVLNLVLVCAFAAMAFGCAAEPTPVSDPLPRIVEAKSARHVKKRPKPTLGERAARIALKAVGVPYSWGGASMSGFDCSGLIYWTYQQLGVELPHSSYALYDIGRRVTRKRMKAGDLLFFSGLGHVGMYLGRGRMIHAPQSGRTVEVVTLRGSHYGARLVGARRIARA
jgi:cell wall-associated NlpC family hydrolase